MKRLIGIAIVAGIAGAVAKMLKAKKAEWSGMTEPQVREKLDTRLPSRMPDDKRQAVADQIVSKMRDQGLIEEEAEAKSGNGQVAELRTADAEASAGDDAAETDTASS